MKKVLIAILLLSSTSAFAQYHGHWRGPHSGYWHPSNGWVVPAIIGGVITYEITKNQNPPVIIQQQPVIIQQPQQTCTEWKEIQYPDGKIYRERTCTQ
jgi:hypothetical protein